MDFYWGTDCHEGEFADLTPCCLAVVGTSTLLCASGVLDGWACGSVEQYTRVYDRLLCFVRLDAGQADARFGIFYLTG